MTQQIGITLLIYIMGLFLFVERPFEEENYFTRKDWLLNIPSFVAQR